MTAPSVAANGSDVTLDLKELESQMARLQLKQPQLMAPPLADRIQLAPTAEANRVIPAEYSTALLPSAAHSSQQVFCATRSSGTASAALQRTAERVDHKVL